MKDANARIAAILLCGALLSQSILPTARCFQSNANDRVYATVFHSHLQPEARTALDIENSSLMRRLFYGEEWRQKQISESGACGVNLQWEQGLRSDWYVEEQRWGRDLIVAGVVLGDRGLIEAGFKAFDWAFTRQATDGSFAGTGASFHSTDMFLGPAGQAILLLNQSELSVEYREKIRCFASKIANAAQWMLLPNVLDRGLSGDRPYTHRRFLSACSIGFAGLLSSNNQMIIKSQELLIEGVSFQRTDGAYPEKGGYDSFYHSVGLASMQRYALFFPDIFANKQISDSMDRGLAWLMTRITGDGVLISAGNTRTAGQERTNAGTIKNATLMPDEAARAFAYSAIRTKNTSHEEISIKLMLHTVMPFSTERLLSLIHQNTELHRKTEISIALDYLGQPAKNVSLSIRQLGHGFMFGCSYPLESKIRSVEARFWDSFGSLFNVAVPENSLKWGNVEREEGKKNYGEVDRLCLKASSMGIKVVGYPLLWGNWPDSGSAVPEWLRLKTKENASKAVERWVGETVNRYLGKIETWCVVCDPLNERFFERTGQDYVEKAFKAARKANPNATLLLTGWAGLLVSGSMQRQDFLELVNGLRGKGVPIDGVGLELSSSGRWYTGQEVYETLDFLSQSGLDLYVTMLSSGADQQPIQPSFLAKGVWNQSTHAEYYEQLYRALFSHPRVKMIVVNDLWDGSALQRGSGLLREDFSAKPAYAMLDKLLNREWRTDTRLMTDKEGRLSLRGFYGTYEISAVINGETYDAVFQVGEHGASQQQVRLRRRTATYTTQISTQTLADAIAVTGNLVWVAATASVVLLVAITTIWLRRRNSRVSSQN